MKALRILVMLSALVAVSSAYAANPAPCAQKNSDCWTNAANRQALVSGIVTPSTGGQGQTATGSAGSVTGAQ